jgi:hypothetical protein
MNATPAPVPTLDAATLKTLRPRLCEAATPELRREIIGLLITEVRLSDDDNLVLVRGCA